MQVALVVFAYLLGSIPFGLIIGRLAGKDVRRTGSGNIGATNVLRAAGKTAGIVTLLLDVAKGYAAVTLAEQFSGPSHALPLICGAAALLGHCFSVFLRFRGGKGVATGLGVFLGIAPFYVIFALGAFLVVVTLTRLVSAGSIAGSITMPIALWIGGASSAHIGVAAAIAALIIAKHHANIARIVSGQENRIGRGPRHP
ncbi:MAG: acyl-phosphate glycerol 3-phosphate acyltransferase [Candidatus Coatesbacteria bacterium]|nr:MAG: acyl-phosphate glycerol 3-phosphate acyltransferase [Candidatus Coatesbacteria bacterium]